MGVSFGHLQLILRTSARRPGPPEFTLNRITHLRSLPIRFARPGADAPYGVKCVQTTCLPRWVIASAPYEILAPIGVGGSLTFGLTHRPASCAAETSARTTSA